MPCVGSRRCTSALRASTRASTRSSGRSCSSSTCGSERSRSTFPAESRSSSLSSRRRDLPVRPHARRRRVVRALANPCPRSRSVSADGSPTCRSRRRRAGRRSPADRLFEAIERWLLRHPLVPGERADVCEDPRARRGATCVSTAALMKRASVTVPRRRSLAGVNAAPPSALDPCTRCRSAVGRPLAQ